MGRVSGGTGRFSGNEAFCEHPWNDTSLYEAVRNWRFAKRNSGSGGGILRIRSFLGGEEETNIACRMDSRDIRVAIPKLVLVSGWLFEAVGEFTVGKIENGLGEI